MNAKLTALPVSHLHIIGLEWEIGKLTESLIRCTLTLHDQIKLLLIMRS
jgi:hypothetical protein